MYILTYFHDSVALNDSIQPKYNDLLLKHRLRLVEELELFYRLEFLVNPQAQ